MDGYRALTGTEIETMVAAGCSAEDWAGVTVKGGFNAGRVWRVTFAGKVTVGALDGSVSVDGVKLPAGLADATLINCELGDNVRVAQVRSHLANYRIGDGAAVTDVGAMTAGAGATFGNGVELETINEGGGRGIRIFNEMSSQFAYLVAMHRHRPEMIEHLEAMVEAAVAQVKSGMGTVGEGAVVAHVGEISDVNVGACAVVSGASSLKNGTVLSEACAPAHVGAAVVAEDFIIGEGSRVDSGAILSHVFVGQGVQVGKQFSGENSLFFANSECFHSETCSVFCGPYSVTHHRSTLLIAGVFSFYNAGSGTNQSNHMYKLGPVHQGILERGSKTGSFSYLLWPSAVGPFSVVIGKHMANFDARDLPFSYITDEGGHTMLTPAMNLSTVGTVRDEEKWPSRDRRKASVKRDQIRFEVFSPLSVQRMIRGEAALTELYKETPREMETARYKGVRIKRLVLRFGVKGYASAIDTYLQGKILDRVASALDDGIAAVRKALAEPEQAVYSEDWMDIGGLLIAQDRLDRLEDDIASGKMASVAEFNAAFQAACNAYPADEWAWVRRAFEARTGRSVDALTADDIHAMQASYNKLRASYTKKVLADAQIEFAESARIGYGVDGGTDEAAADFEAVRGSYAENSFVKQMEAALAKVSEG